VNTLTPADLEHVNSRPAPDAEKLAQIRALLPDPVADRPRTEVDAA
jgi:hypothetical protein